MNDYRKIVFDGFDTLAEGLRICSEKSKTSGAEIRTTSDVIPYRDGSLTTPTGRASAKLTYCLIIHEESRAKVERKARYIIDRFSGKKGDLIDSDCFGKKYTNAVFTGAESLEYPSGIFTAAYLTLNFEANPVLYDIMAANERICQAIITSDSFYVAIEFHDNSYYTIFGGTPGPAGQGEYHVERPYTYRVLAYAEADLLIFLSTYEDRGGSEPTPVIVNEPIEVGEIFTMPENGYAVIDVYAIEGMAYVEVWHDSRNILSGYLRDNPDYGFVLDSSSNMIETEGEA